MCAKCGINTSAHPRVLLVYLVYLIFSSMFVLKRSTGNNQVAKVNFKVSEEGECQ